MKLKKLLLLAILMLSVDLCAQEESTIITFDAATPTDKGKVTEAKNIPDTISKGGVRIVCTDAAFNTTEEYRFYEGPLKKPTIIEVSSSIGTLNKIVFYCVKTGRVSGSPYGLQNSTHSYGSVTRSKNDDKKLTWSNKGNNNNVLFFVKINPTVICSKIEVTLDKYPNTTTISSAGYATYCCDKAVDYTKTYGLVAYKAKYDSEKKMIVLTKVGKVPANTPVVLKGEGGLYGFPTLESAPKAVTDNDLKVATANMTCTDNMWILVKKSTGVGFVPATPGTTLAKGKCYLLIESGASSKFLPFDETTGISHISPNAVRSDGKTYNILGQEVGNDYKGIVIVDGKKMVRK